MTNSTIFRSKFIRIFRRSLFVAFALTITASPMAQEAYAIPKPPNPIVVADRYRPTIHTTTSQSFVGASMEIGDCVTTLFQMEEYVVDTLGHEIDFSGCVNDKWAIQ